MHLSTNTILWRSDHNNMVTNQFWVSQAFILKKIMVSLKIFLISFLPGWMIFKSQPKYCHIGKISIRHTENYNNTTRTFWFPSTNWQLAKIKSKKITPLLNLSLGSNQGVTWMTKELNKIDPGYSALVFLTLFLSSQAKSFSGHWKNLFFQY